MQQNANPFFINTRNFKKKNSAQVPLAHVSKAKRIVEAPISSGEVVVDDYNPNYSASMIKGTAFVKSLASVQKMSRNQPHMALYSPQTQPVYSTTKKGGAG